jgi:hypothetical protein
MTSSTAKPGSKAFEAFRKAGSMFGLNLAGLFDDDEDGEQSGFEGFSPAFKVTSQLKGRSPSTMGYKAPSMPARTAEFSLGQTPTTLGNVNISNQASVAQTPTEAQPQKPAMQISSEYGADPAYFGHEDYWRNIERGASTSDVKSFLEKNINLLRGGNVPGGGGLYDQVMSGNVPTLGSSGSTYYQQQQQSQPQPAPSYSISAGQSADYLGHADVESAKSSGASNQQIAQWIKSNQDKLRGANVAGGGGLYDEYRQYM